MRLTIVVENDRLLQALDSLGFSCDHHHIGDRSAGSRQLCVPYAMPHARRRSSRWLSNRS